MAAAVFVSAAIGAADNTPTLETGAFTVGGSNRVLYVLVGSGAGTPVDPTAVKWGGSGGTSLTQLTTLDMGSNAKASLWRLIAPAAGSNTVHATWGGNQDERWIIAVQVQDADQTTPNNTVATATGTNAAPTVAATSVSGDLVLDFVSFLDIGGFGYSLTDDVPDSLQELEGGGGISAFEGAGASRETAAGTSTTCSWTVGGTLAGGGWGIFAAAINAAPAGAPFDLDPTSGVALHGAAGITGNINAGTPVVVDVAPTSGIAMAGRLAASGNVGVRRPWEFETPLQVRQMAGELRVTGDIGFTIPFNVTPLSAVTLHGMLATAGDVGVAFGGPFDVAPLHAVSLHGLLATTGDIATPVSFDVAPLAAVSLQGRLATTGDVRAGSPFDLATGGIALRGSLSTAGEIASNDTPPAPPPAPAEDPLDSKFLARRKRPNIRMRWGAGEEPEPAADTAPAAIEPIEPAPEPPRMARGLDLELLPDPPAAPAVPAAATAPTASAPLAAPAAPSTAALPPDLTAEVAALRAAHASLQQEMQQTAAQAVQRAADIYTALQQQTAHLERELAQARSEIAALRAKVERDARNRRRAEEIARKLLDNK